MNMRFNMKQLVKLRGKNAYTQKWILRISLPKSAHTEEIKLNIGQRTTMHAFSVSSLCDYLVVRGEASTGSCPGDLGRRISGGKTVELQTLALLDVSYRWLDADH